MYEAVHAHPDGDATVARFARAADRYGFDGVVVREQDARPDYERVRESLRDDGLDVDVVDAVEVVSRDVGSASGSVGNWRNKRTLVLVRGGSPTINRFAVEQRRVDVLTRPLAGDGDVNHVLVKAARDNEVRLEFDFGPVLRRDGGPRVTHLRGLRKLRELVEYYDAPFVVSATPRSHLQLRAPRELVAVGEQIGFSEEQVREGLAAWGEVATRNRERTSESFISPGVERGRYEEDA